MQDIKASLGDMQDKITYFVEFIKLLKTKNRKRYKSIKCNISNYKSIFVLGANESEFSDFLKNIDSEKLTYLNPIVNEGPGKINVKYEPNSEYAIAVIMAIFLYSNIKDEAIFHLLHNADLGNLIAESNISENEMIQLQETLEDYKNTLFLVGPDFYFNENYKKIAKVFSFLDCIEGLEVLCLGLPSFNNINFLEKCKLPEDSNYNVINLDSDEDLSFALPTSEEYGKILLLDPELKEGIGLVIYLANKIGDFESVENNTLFVSNQFLLASKLKEGNTTIKVDNNLLNVNIIVNKSLKGVIAILISDDITCAKRYYDFYHES